LGLQSAPILQSRYFWVALVGLWAAAYLTNLNSRALRLEEGRRAGPALKMLETGDFVRPTLYGATYLSKPPLYFWVTAATGWLIGGVGEWAVRLPSAISALLLALVLAGLTRDMFSTGVHRLAALFCLSGFVMLDKGTLGEIDVLFTLLVVLSLWTWWRFQSNENPTAAAWIASGAIISIALLAKGPPALVLFWLPVVSFLAVTGRLGSLLSQWPIVGFALSLAPIGAWVVALANHPSEPTTLAHAYSIWRGQMALGDPVLAHGGAWHLVKFPVDVIMMMLPWGLLAWLPVLRGVRQRAESSRRPLLFLACQVVPTLAFFYLWPISRARYVLPLYPAVCMLAAVGAVGLRGLLRWPWTNAASTNRVPIFWSQRCAGLATAILVGWFACVSLAFRPWKARTDHPHLFFEGVTASVGRANVYTDLLFPRDQDMFNHFFYFNPRFAKLEELGRSERCIVLCRPESVEKICSQTGLNARFICATANSDRVRLAACLVEPRADAAAAKETSAKTR
jgi:4-amino-4-deoxy-L-arabinose transferase-like glycosyltransferase